MGNNKQKTGVVCKSDCYFSDKITRICQLGVIELIQSNPESPILSCNQYVKAEPIMAKNESEDISRARNAGRYLAAGEM